MEIEKIKAIIESILFVSGEPVKLERIVKLIGCEKPDVESALLALGNDYTSGRGLMLLKKDEMVELVAHPDNAQFISDLVKSEIQENLSRAALEVLSIIAYRGPLSRADIEAIRGVNCSFTVRSLLMRGLVERLDNPNDNRGYHYKISFDFLKKLGIESPEKLPDWEVLSKDERINSIINP